MARRGKVLVAFIWVQCTVCGALQMEVTESADASAPSGEGRSAARWRPLLPVLLALGGGGPAEAGSLPGSLPSAGNGRAAVGNAPLQQGQARPGLLDAAVLEADRDRLLGLRGGALWTPGPAFGLQDAASAVSAWWYGDQAEDERPEMHFDDDFQDLVCGPLQCADAATTAVVDLLSPLAGDTLAMELATYVNNANWIYSVQVLTEMTENGVSYAGLQELGRVLGVDIWTPAAVAEILARSLTGVLDDDVVAELKGHALHLKPKDLKDPDFADAVSLIARRELGYGALNTVFSRLGLWSYLDQPFGLASKLHKALVNVALRVCAAHGLTEELGLSVFARALRTPNLRPGIDKLLKAAQKKWDLLLVAESLDRMGLGKSEWVLANAAARGARDLLTPLIGPQAEDIVDGIHRDNWRAAAIFLRRVAEEGAPTESDLRRLARLVGVHVDEWTARSIRQLQGPNLYLRVPGTANRQLLREEGTIAKVDKEEVAELPEYTLSEIEIPTVAEVDHWAKELAKIPATGAYDVSEAVDYGIRFSLLTFRRSTNDAVTIDSLVEKQKAKFGNPHYPDCVMIHVQSNPAEDEWDAGNHATVYLFKVGDNKVGAVISFKSSSSKHDWTADFNFTSEDNAMTRRPFTRRKKGETTDWWSWWRKNDTHHVDPVLPGDVKVHPGFLRYYREIEEVMDGIRAADVPLLRDLPDLTGDDTLRTWLYNGGWEWCVFTGHSLGAAQAQVAAMFTAHFAQAHEGPSKKPLLITYATPISGNKAFNWEVEQTVAPAGGLWVYNNGDLIVRGGYAFSRFGDIEPEHPGRVLRLDPLERYTGWNPLNIQRYNQRIMHNTFYVPSTGNGAVPGVTPRQLVKFNANDVHGPYPVPMDKHENYAFVSDVKALHWLTWENQA